MEQQVVAGRYQVVREIARGGMGSVHEAVHVVSKKRVALKLLFPTFAKDEASRQRFLREASAPAQIGHEGIVEVYDAGVDTDGTLFVAMELLEGGTVRDRLERGNISLPEFFSIFLRTLEPLAAAHQRGIIHRDLKPENVFLVKKPNGSEVLKILDFGIARDLEAQQQSMTQTGTAMGTPHYMAPEQAMSARGVVATADVWAIGAMMYEVVTGAVPFEGETASAVIVHVCVQPLRSLAEAAPGVPGPLAALIERCLSKEPAGRPRDAAALLAELQAVANQLGVHVPASTTFPTGAQGSHASQGAHPSQPSHAAAAQPTGAPAGFGSSPGHATGPGMAGAAAHQNHPSSPAMQGAGMQQPYPGQQGYPSQGGYPAQAPSHPGMPGVGMPQQGFPSQPGMPGAPYGQTGFAGQAGQAGHAGHAGHPGQPAQGAYPPPGQFGTYAAAPTYTEPTKGSNRGLIIGITSGVAIVAVGLGAYFAFGRSPEATASSVTPAIGAPVGVVDPTAPGVPSVPVAAVPAAPAAPAVPTAVGVPGAATGFTEPTGAGARRFPGTLATGDRTLQSGEFADSYQVTFAAGQRFRARVHAEKFDPYIIVRAPSNASQDNDDANANTHDSELVITASEAGTWTFIATSFQPGEMGDYELSVETLP